jgi:hypothetical protein
MRPLPHGTRRPRLSRERVNRDSGSSAADPTRPPLGLSGQASSEAPLPSPEEAMNPERHQASTLLLLL